MTCPAIFVAATPINPSPSSIKIHVISPFLCACSSDSFFTVRNLINRRSNRLPWIKASASKSTVIADNPTPSSTSEEGKIQAKIGARIEFFEILEGRGDDPVKFFAHLKEDEFDYLD
ncbi:hypothetical protein E3N88_04195 [Mikania micrantha]|uniref:Uncharacterized protein n=1 Tax=Mikania micrantha TaxID=192012 RepID=A0A5N6PUZ6_9ASTR|nr:hypothetical protein E3N88_04195 [Mikania micrantha]